MTRHLLAIDQGTTGSTVLVMDVDGRTLGRATREFPQHFPKPGWVEHEPEEIWDSVRIAIGGALQRSEEHTSELQSRPHLVCRLLLEKKNPAWGWITGRINLNCQTSGTA